jgi:anthranilate/para-aminobenzoate synthase component II
VHKISVSQAVRNSYYYYISQKAVFKGLQDKFRHIAYHSLFQEAVASPCAERDEVLQDNNSSGRRNSQTGQEGGLSEEADTILEKVSEWEGEMISPITKLFHR